MAAYLYLCHPGDFHFPGMCEWVQAAIEAVGGEAGWQDYRLQPREYDKNCSLSIQQLCAEVTARRGPVLFLRPIQNKVFDTVQQRLGSRVTVLLHDASDVSEVLAGLQRIREIHESGEPHLARRLVVALLVLRKLEQEKMWGGRNKGYMWADELPKGRGVKEEYGDGLDHILNLLYQHQLIISKKSGARGGSGTKWACNPENRDGVYEALRSRTFKETLRVILCRDKLTVSARELDLLDCYDSGPPRLANYIGLSE
jgi:hypothetical protein